MDRFARLTEVFRTIFADDELVIARTTTAQDIDGWDSMAHVRLLLSVEKAFKVKFTTLEIANLKNVGELLDLIQAKLGAE